MRWKKLRKTIIEHPYLISDDFHISMRQAARIQEEEGYPSFEEMVVCAKERSTLPDDAWDSVYAAINNYDDSSIKPERNYISFTRPIMRWALIGLCLILILGYFTFIPSGRALANSIAKVIVRILDDGFLFKPASTPTQSQGAVGFEETISNYNDFNAAEKSIGRQFLQINSEEYTLYSLQLYDSNVAGKRLYAFYKTDDNLMVSLYQQWDLQTDFWNMISSDETVWRESLSDGTTVYCLIDSLDKTFTAYAIWHDTVVTLYADSGIPYADVLALLK